MFKPKVDVRAIGGEWKSTLGVPVEFLLEEISGSKPVYFVKTKAFSTLA